jgi:hypothetical protein
VSNLTDFLFAEGWITNIQTSAAAKIGGAIGTLSDIAGVLGGLSSVWSTYQLLEQWFGGGVDQTQVLLQDILTTVENVYKLLNQINRDMQLKDFQDWTGMINNTLVDTAVSIAENLQSDLTASPPLSSGDKSSRLEACLAAVNSLSYAAAAGGVNQLWLVHHDYQIYFAPTNPWLYEGGGLPNTGSNPAFPFTYYQRLITFVSTPQNASTFDPEPGAGPGSSVFNYIYILPAYLRTIFFYLAVGVGFYPNFGQDAPDHADQLRAIADDLLSVHDTIKGGIVSIVAPSLDDVIPYYAATDITQDPPWDYPAVGVAALNPISTIYPGESLWEQATVTIQTAVDNPYATAPPTDYIQPYGAVNLYSGYSSVGSYPPGVFYTSLRQTLNAWVNPDPSGTWSLRKVLNYLNSLGYPANVHTVRDLTRNRGVAYPSNLGLPAGYTGSFPPPHAGPGAWPSQDWYLGFYGKYLLRTLARNKDVYSEVGLSVVWQTINRLYSLVGDPPLFH